MAIHLTKGFASPSLCHQPPQWCAHLGGSWTSNHGTEKGLGENFSTTCLSFPFYSLKKKCHLKYECSIIKVNLSSAESSENYKNKEKKEFDLSTQRYCFVLFPSTLPVQIFITVLYLGYYLKKKKEVYLHIENGEGDLKITQITQKITTKR